MQTPTPQVISLEADSPLPIAVTCDGCGGLLEPGDAFCNHCGRPAARPELPAVTDAKFLKCQQCGAEISREPDQRSLRCPFCDSNYVVEFSPDLASREQPEFVIGFHVTPTQALERYHLWIKQNSWFRPGDLATGRADDKMQGIYLPFWTFSMLAESAWSATIGEYWYRTETYTVVVNGKTETRTRTVQETEWWPLAGQHHQYYSGYLVSASRGLPQADADRIKPFHLAGIKRFASYFLAGWACEEYSLEKPKALDICQQEFYRQERNHVAAFMPGDTQRDLNVRTTFSQVQSDLVLLPIYIMSYMYQGKLYRFLLNGQTGRCEGDKPISWRRILALVLGVLLLVAILAAVIAAITQGSR